MIFAKDHKTLDMFDPRAHFGFHRRERLEKSWAWLFREEILPELPVHKHRPFFSESKGAPTKDLYAMLGIALQQQMHELNDEETIDRVAFDLKWHYALNLTEGKAGDVYVCPKTLWTLRHLLSGNGLSGLIFQTATEKLTKLFSVNPSRQRLDSTHIFSNMRHLGRIGLFARVIKTFLVNLKRRHKALFDVQVIYSVAVHLTDREVEALRKEDRKDDRWGRGENACLGWWIAGRTLTRVENSIMQCDNRFPFFSQFLRSGVPGLTVWAVCGKRA